MTRSKAFIKYMSSAMPKAFCSNGVVAPANLALCHRFSDNAEAIDDPRGYSSSPSVMFLFFEFDPFLRI